MANTQPNPIPPDTDQAEDIMADVMLQFSKEYPLAPELSRACRLELAQIFRATIIKGLKEVGVDQWDQRRNYAFMRIRQVAAVLKRQDKPVSEVTPADLGRAVEVVSTSTQEAMRRLDPSVREFFDDLPGDISDDELREHLVSLFPFCPIPP